MYYYENNDTVKRASVAKLTGRSVHKQIDHDQHYCWHPKKPC